MAFVDLAIDSTTGDLAYPSRLIDGADATRQRIQIRLGTFLGEYILDTSQGLPYAAWAQMKPAQPATISARIRAEVAGTPGVQAVTEWSYTYDAAARSLTITGYVRIEGETTVQPIRVEVGSKGQNAYPMLTLFL